VVLQAGYHRIVLVAANNGPVPRIDLLVNGGGVNLRPIPADWLAHIPEGVTLPPPMQDAAGMRLATAVPDAKPMIKYRTYEVPERPWRDAREALTELPASTGFAELIDSSVGEAEAANLAGIAFEGLIHVPKDDTYTFSLQSTGAAALMIDTVSRIATGDRWSLVLRDGSRLTASITRWTDRDVTLSMGGGRTLTVPVSEIDLLWPSPTEGVPLPVELQSISPAAGEDVALVNNDDKHAIVKGIVKGRDGDVLLFRFNDNDRRLAINKLKGLRFAKNPKPLPARTHQVTFANGDVLHGTVIAADDQQITLATPWGEKVEVAASQVAAIAVLNGRRVYLSDLQPTAVEEVPYFSRVMRYRRDVSFNGEPLRVAPDGPPLSRGLCVHTYSALTFDLAGGFTTLRTIVGFQQPQGKLGRASLRIEADGKVLWENADMRGIESPVELNLDVKGVKKLTLIADFGQEQDVGDRVVWGEARVVRVQTR
jgi:hypothetical protein